MRQWLDLIVESSMTLYHGSRERFPVGKLLTPQNDGYVTDPNADDQHHMLEKVMEKYRPEHCVSRFKAVFLVTDPEDIDYAGGYNDNVYGVEPMGPVTKCNMNWYSAAYALCEHEVLSQQEAKAQGREWYPDWEEDELKEYVLNYWNAVPKDAGDLYEYLVESATVVKVLDA